jgi:hypothetical protein
MDPREFLDVAKSLIDGPNPSPAACRTVIGRSYYAAFNVACELVDELQIPLDKAKDSHSEILDIIVASQDHKLKGACDLLKARKAVRVHADHRMDKTDVEGTVKAGREYLLALNIISTFEQVRANETQWKAASDNMKEHAKTVLKKPI